MFKFEIPKDFKIIYGTHKMSVESITNAINCGYTAIDTATGYNNGPFIKTAIENSKSVPIIVTKFNTNDFKDFDTVVAEHINTIEYNPHVVLLHTPFPTSAENIDAMKRMNQCFISQTVGVSNFDIKRLIELINAGVKPEIIQLEFHPFYQPNKLVKFCQNNGIKIMCYRPLAKGAINQNEIIKKIAKFHKATPAQIILKWIIGKNIVPVVSSTNVENIKNNLDFNKINLRPTDVSELDSLNQGSVGATCMLRYCSHDEN